jgi:hypothetical protein
MLYQLLRTHDGSEVRLVTAAPMPKVPEAETSVGSTTTGAQCQLGLLSIPIAGGRRVPGPGNGSVAN